MVDLEKLTSRHGARIEFHFEKEENKEDMAHRYTRRELQKKLRNQINIEGTDTGRGTVVHMLINQQGKGKTMRADEYAEWQSEEDKDWFHSSLGEALDEMLSMAMAVNMFDDFGGMSVIEIRMVGPEADKFVGPTMEEMNEFLSNPEDLRRMEEIHDSERCDLCLIPTGLCPNRSASFDAEGIKKALAAFKKPSAE